MAAWFHREWLLFDRFEPFQQGLDPGPHSVALGTSEAGNCVSYATRTLGLRRSGRSRSETLSVHSCSIATQTPAPGRRDASHAIRVSTKLESGITPLTVQTISQPKSTNGIRNLLQRHLAVC